MTSAIVFQPLSLSKLSAAAPCRLPLVSLTYFEIDMDFYCWGIKMVF